MKGLQVHNGELLSSERLRLLLRAGHLQKEKQFRAVKEWSEGGRLDCPVYWSSGQPPTRMGVTLFHHFRQRKSKKHSVFHD
jgi:hypothetical protein